MQKYLKPTPILDADHPLVQEYARNAVKEQTDPVQKAVHLYYSVRDPIRYDPYSPFFKPEHYQASELLKIKRSYCVGKAALLCALGRAAGIPSRVGFATVKNHIATRQLIEALGSNLFVYHGFTEFFLNGKWVKATPAFNKELCKIHNVEPLEFDGLHDSIFHAYNNENRRYMEYVEEHGSFSDIPIDLIISAWKKEYGEKRVKDWIQIFEAGAKRMGRQFEKEEVISP